MENINLHWNFIKGNIIENSSLKGEIVSIPHNIGPTRQRYFDYSFFGVYSYWKDIDISLLKDEKLILDVQGILLTSELYINNIKVQDLLFGYTGEQIDITDYLINGINRIVFIVTVDENKDIPPCGGLIDYIVYGGIYRPLSLIKKKDTYVKNVFVSPSKESITFNIEFNKEYNGLIELKVINNEQEIKHIFNCKDQKINCEIKNNLSRKWDIDDPFLYEVLVSINSDEHRTYFGNRTFTYKKNIGFILNDKPLKLIGINRHQSYPFIGYAASGNLQRKDAQMIKDLGMNVVRCSHYPQSIEFLRACDEIGLLVIEEIPGWQFIGGDQWKDHTIEYVKRMIIRDFNHPSIAFWGVRVNESEDDEKLYLETNELAHKLDRTRFTTGTRYKPSQFLEDVFSFNDFSNNGQLTSFKTRKEATLINHDFPYLISEYCGHTYPVRIEDNEKDLIHQALVAALMIDHVYSHNDIIGALMWCLFDYQTHEAFGSGDKICHHGILDEYRFPKYAASVFKSQKDISQEIVLEPLSTWAYGELPMGGVVPLYVFSNCDQVVLQVDGKEPLRLVQDDKRFKHMKHPPFIAHDLGGAWGKEWKSATFFGLVNGKTIISKRFTNNQLPISIEVSVSNDVLNIGEYIELSLIVVDQCHNPLRLYDGVVAIEVNERCKLMSPSFLAFSGGHISFYVLAKELGEGVITIKSEFETFVRKVTIK